MSQSRLPSKGSRGRRGSGPPLAPCYHCTVCGTPFYRRSTPEATFTCVVTLVAYGCPPPAIEAAFEAQRQSIADWTDAARVQ